MERMKKSYKRIFLWVFYGMLVVEVIDILSLCDAISYLWNAPEQQVTYVPWELSEGVTIARLLAWGGFLNNRAASIFDRLIGITRCLLYIVIIIYAIWGLKRCVLDRPFEKSIVRKMKIGVGILILIPTVLVVFQLLLLIITQPPINWSSYVYRTVVTLFQSLFFLVLLRVLIYAWEYGRSLQNEIDEVL